MYDQLNRHTSARDWSIVNYILGRFEVRRKEVETRRGGCDGEEGGACL